MVVSELAILTAYRQALDRTGDEGEAHKAAEMTLAEANPEVTDDFLIALQVGVILARYVLSGDLESAELQRSQFTQLPR